MDAEESWSMFLRRNSRMLPSAAHAASKNAVCSLSLSSFAAASLYTRMSISDTGTPLSASAIILRTMVVVLPLPAEAETSTLPLSPSAAFC